MMFPLNAPSVTFTPLRYRPHGLGNWSGHLLFARDLIAALRPSVVVELGAFYGESYFTLCQSLVESNIPGAAFAIDTWQGDPHSGSYGEEVFQEVEAYNSEHYPAVSRLLRMTFDEAVTRFDDESIDLLHIDGLHTYEAVRHDFETWFGKVSRGGVVLLHDTVMRHDDFGVWRFWQELQQRYAHFNFEHSCGLGVIRKPGAPLPEAGILPLLFKAEAAESVKKYYARCADAIEFRYRNERQGSWDIGTQLFWRADNETFTEERSVTLYHTVQAQASTVVLRLPKLAVTPAEFRLDVSDRPVLLHVNGLRAVDSSGNVGWTLALDTTAPDFPYAGMQITRDCARNGMLVSATGPGSSMLLPVQAGTPTAFAGGGTLELTMRALDPAGYAAELNAVMNCRLAQDESRIRDYARALAEAQRLVAERNAHLEEYRIALAHAESIVAQRNLELREYVIALGASQTAPAESQTALAESRRAMAEQETALRRLALEIEETTQLLRDGKTKLAAACRQLNDLERSLSWRLSKPLRWVERVFARIVRATRP